MSVRLPGELPVEHLPDSVARGFAAYRHGELLVGKVTRIAPDGQASVRFPDVEVQAPAGSLLQAGKRVFAHVQKNRDDTLLSLLPNVQEGEILTGTLAASESSEGVVRFGKSELIVPLPSSEGPLPTAGAQVRAQLQVFAGKPLLRMLPAGVSRSAVSGTVITERNDGTILLETGGTVLIAKSEGGLEAGDYVQAAVRHIGDKLILQVLLGAPSTEEARAASDLPTGSGLQGKIAELVAKFLATPQYARLLDALVSGELKVDGAGRDLLLLLQQLIRGAETDKTAWISTLATALETILLSPQEEGFTEQLSNAVRDSGIFLESRLLQAALSQEPAPSISGDLKLALLLADQKLSGMLHPAEAEGGELPSHLTELAAKVGQLLDTVRAEQLLNLRILPSHQTYIQFPFAPGAGLDRVEIRISHHGKGRARELDPKNVLLTLAVSTSGLGRIKASLSIIEGQVSCQFKATSQWVVDLFVDNADTLRRGLEKLDYRVAYIGCTMSNNENDFSVFDEPVSIAQEGFDVHI